MIDLGKVMVVPKGAYNANTTYEILDLVTYNGGSYIALKSTKDNMPTNTTYWQLHGQGYSGTVAGVSAKDTQGMVVTAGSNSTVKTLIDTITDRVMTKFFAKADIVQIESVSTTKVSSSAYLKQVKDDINSNFDKYYSLSVAIQTPSGADLNNYTDFGSYISSAVSILSTLQNCLALNGGFVLYVERVTGATDGTSSKQRIVYNEAKSLEYQRVKTGEESWGTWVFPTTNTGVQKESTAGISYAPNAITESTITFPRAFGSALKVVVSFYNDTTSAKYGMLAPMVYSVTTTNFKIRIANVADVDLTPAIYQIAAI